MGDQFDESIDRLFDNGCNGDIIATCDATFPSIPGILDNDDLKVNGLWCCTLGIYQFLYIGLFAALFITNYLNESGVLYLAPYTPDHSAYCSSKSIAITSSYWIDENGYFEGITTIYKYTINTYDNIKGDINYDASNTVYRIDMKNMKISLEEYKDMMIYFENEVKAIATRAASRDATYSFIAYSCYNIRYFPKGGGRVDFYSSGDARIIFNSIYSGQNVFFASDDDVCVPANIEVKYEESKSSIVPTFPTYRKFPTPAPVPVPVQRYFQPYRVGNTTDIIEIELCGPGEYKFSDCDCDGDQYLQLFKHDPGNSAKMTLSYDEYGWYKPHQLASSDDECGPYNSCSNLKYYYKPEPNEPVCKQFLLTVSSYYGPFEDVKGQLSISGPKPNITIINEAVSVSCSGYENTNCTLTCPNDDQKIDEILFAGWDAFWGYFDYTDYLVNSYSYCYSNEVKTVSENLLAAVKLDCIGKDSCSIPYPSNVASTCDDFDDDYYAWTQYAANTFIVAYCGNASPSFEPTFEPTTASPSFEPTFEPTTASPSFEPTFEPTTTRRKLDMVTRVHSTSADNNKLNNIMDIQISNNKKSKTEKKINQRKLEFVSRRLASKSDQNKDTVLVQPCYNDLTKKYVLEIGADLGFYDTGEEAITGIDVRSLATVLSINSGLAQTTKLTKTASFENLIRALNSSEYLNTYDDYPDDASRAAAKAADQANFDILIKRDVAYYSDEFYDDMEPIICAKVPLSTSRVVELCAMDIGGTLAIPILSSEGLSVISALAENGDIVDVDDNLKDLFKLMCIFQTGKQRCDRFNTIPDCELDYTEKYGEIAEKYGTGYNNYYLGLIYISKNDLKNQAMFSQYLEWMEILLKFMEQDIDNYDDNFQSAAYRIMSTYSFVHRFYDLQTSNGTYNHDAHDMIMNNSFLSYTKRYPFEFPAYGTSLRCPLEFKTMLKNSFNDLCGDVKCKMMMMTYRNPNDAFSFLLGNNIGVGTSRFKAGKQTTYYDQLYRPTPFKMIREAPPEALVENVLTCRPNPNTIFINSIGITYSNSQLILGILFSVVAAMVVRLWNCLSKEKKVYSVTRKNYVYKQTISAALNCIDDRMKYLEKKCGHEDLEHSSLYTKILHSLDLVDQVDDIDPNALIALVEAMKISPPIVVHQQKKQEDRQKRKSIKIERRKSKNTSFFRIAPAPRDDNDNNNGNKAIELTKPIDV